MIKGIFSSENAMRPKMTRMEVLANNLANVNSTGYKRDRLFVQMLKEGTTSPPDARGAMDNVEVDRYIDMREGPLQQTDNPLNLAIDGPGFFVAETSQGTRYTRNGNFTLSTDGSLVTAEGDPVMGNDGKIRLPNFEHLEMKKIKITPSGEVLEGDQHVAQLRVVNITDPEMLQKDQHGMLMPREGQRVTEIPDDQRVIRQGFLEESNVNGIEEMMAMIELSRGFETDQRIIKAQDATLDRSLDVGRI
jgi:flagellar basal-body rod protein FlgF